MLNKVSTTLLIWTMSTAAFATTQCPAEFGPKDPMIDVLGWVVVMLGIVVGGLLFGYLVKRSLSRRLISRILLTVLGLGSFVLMSLAGLGIAITFFFLQC